MNQNEFSKRAIIVSLLLSISIVIGITLQTYFFHKTRIVFCDVGQGDATYIRTSEGVDILIDAGPSRAVVDCLGKYMPFYDHVIELAFLTHPQKDHYGGYPAVLKGYVIETFITVPLDSQSQSFQKLLKQLKEQSIEITYLYAGDQLVVGSDVAMTFLWPDRQFAAENNNPKTDPNLFSQVVIFKQGFFEALFTGDATEEVLSKIDTSDLDFYEGLDILKIPHHGSKKGLSKRFLDLADPRMSVIMVGRKNRYGHPSREIIDLLEASKKVYVTTAVNGNISIEKEERGFSVNSDAFHRDFLFLEANR